MKTLLPFPLVGLGAVAPAPPDLVQRVQARARVALKASAEWFPPAVNIRARAKLALNASAFARVKAPVEFAVKANAVWREPPGPSRARVKLALTGHARVTEQAYAKLALTAHATWQQPPGPSRARCKLAVNASARATEQAYAKLALNATAVWVEPVTPSKARVRLALHANARPATQAKSRLALQANATWREPIIPSRARAKLALNANARPPSVGIWPNGFVGQIEVRLEAQAGGTTVTNALLPLIITNPALRTTANGGLSQNAGFDVQIEMVGVALGWVRLHWLATTGLWAGLVNIPSRNFAVDESLMVYVGRAGHNGWSPIPARAGGWLGWWGGGSVTDITETGGRDLVNHGATVGGLDGLPAWAFNGVDQYLDQANSSYLNGLTAVTAVQVYEPDTENESRELWNVSVGAAGELGYRLDSAGRRVVAIAKWGASVLAINSADNTAPHGTSQVWWTLPIRSGRPWAAGPSVWWDRPDTATTDYPTATQAFLDEEQDVALLDAVCGSAKETAAGVSTVADWNGVIGGAVGSAMDTTGTQFDWSPTMKFGLGPAIAYLPVGSAWLAWMVDTIPASEATTASNSHIWTDITRGDHDTKYRAFGARVVQKMAAIGWPLNRLIIDINHEMNQSNSYQVFPGQAANYKAAMERTIGLMREGAGTGNTLRFMHRPAFHTDAPPRSSTKPGTYLEYCPSTVDVLSLSMHPMGPDVHDDASITAMFRGTLNANWHGTDELLLAATALGLPIAFPEWSPEDFGTSDFSPCTVANQFTTRFYNEILAPNAARLVCDCVFSQGIRLTTAFSSGASAAAKAEWTAMVANRKVLWSGIKLDSGTSPFVKVYPMDIASPGGKTVTRPAFNNPLGENAYTIPANTIYDFRGRVGDQHTGTGSGGTTYRFNSATATSTACGGKSITSNSVFNTMPYAELYEKGNSGFLGGHSPGLRTQSSVTGSKFQGFFLHGTSDAVVPDSDFNSNPTYENFCFIVCRDDGFQGDDQCPCTLHNGYIQAHAGYSMRPGSGSPATDLGHVITMENVLYHMDRQPNHGDTDAWKQSPGGGSQSGQNPDFGHASSRRTGQYRGPTNRGSTLTAQQTEAQMMATIETGPHWMAHKWFFKTRAHGSISGAYMLRLYMKNCLLRIDTMPVEGPGGCVFPPLGDGVGTGSTYGSAYDNVTVLSFIPNATTTSANPPPASWDSLGMPQSKAQLAAMGITVIDDETAAWALWSTTVADWLSANGWDGGTADQWLTAPNINVNGTFAWNRQ